MKTCTKCLTPKEINDFPKKGDGRSPWCRECFAAYYAARRDYYAQYRLDNKEKIRETNKQYGQKNRDIIKQKNATRYQKNKEAHSEKAKRYRRNNKEKIRAEKQKYNREHEDEIKVYQMAYRTAHKEGAREYKRNYYQVNKEKRKQQEKELRTTDEYKNKKNKNHKQRLESDIQYKLRTNLRIRLNVAIKNNRKSGSAVKDLGCSVPELRVWLEALFQPGMTWENWGRSG